jgi:hypothetical protein
MLTWSICQNHGQRHAGNLPPRRDHPRSKNSLALGHAPRKSEATQLRIGKVYSWLVTYRGKFDPKIKFLCIFGPKIDEKFCGKGYFVMEMQSF